VRRFVFGTYALGLSSVALALSGCGGARQTQGETPPIVAPAAERPAKTIGSLLYASDRQNLYAMTYPQAKLVDTLSGFSSLELRGICGGANGEIYVTSYGYASKHESPEVYVFEHGATSPSRVLSSPYGARACAADPVSGDLAVITDTNYPSLAIYPKAQGSPTLYNDGAYMAGTYDDNGNLYLASTSFVGDSPLTFFANGKFTAVTLDQHIPWARDIQWQNGVLVATAGAKKTKQQVYWVTLNSSTNGHVEEAFILERKRKAIPRFGVPDLIVGKTIMAPGHSRGQLDFWKYPKGGEPDRSVTEPVRTYFTGLAISIQP
jgi:hypothetical protein